MPQISQMSSYFCIGLQKNSSDIFIIRSEQIILSELSK